MSRYKRNGIKCLFVVLFQKLNDAHIILKRYLMGFRERLNIWYIAPRSLKGSDDVLGQCNRVQFEVRLEQKVDDIINAPFA